MSFSEGNVPLLELKGISKSFPGVKALQNINLTFTGGKVHVLVGENGAGKSTLIKIINGMYSPDEGEVFVDGKKVSHHTPENMMNLGVATIHQELSPVLDMSIAENIFLGREKKLVNWKEMYQEAEKLIRDLGFSYNPRDKMRTLSVSDMQIIEIIKAISKNARLIIMDEPTSSITDSDVEVLFQQVEQLKAKGIAIIYITHKMDEIFQIGNEVSVLRDGQLISSHAIETLTKAKIISMMVGRDVNEVYPTNHAAVGDELLELKGLGRKSVFENVNLSLKRGEILGVAGLIGAGRTEIFRCVFGLDHYDEGEIYLENEKIQVRSVNDAVKYGIMMIPEDRKDEGLVLCRSIAENMSLPNLDKYKFGVINEKREMDNAKEMSEKLKIKAPSCMTSANSLSGGNQQKIVIAKWLLHNPKVLIMDEPTRGIDVGAKSEIYKIMCELAESGVAIIMISSEMPELLGMCQRIAVISNGKKTGELSVEEMTQERIMELAVKGFENE